MTLPIDGDRNDSEIVKDAWTEAKAREIAADNNTKHGLLEFRRERAEGFLAGLEIGKEAGRREWDEWKLKEIERLAWNLAGCLTYAESRSTGDPHAAELSTPALEAVRKLVEDFQKQREAIQKLVEAAAEVNKVFGCQNAAEIEEDQWIVCRRCVSCDLGEALAPFLGPEFQKPEGLGEGKP